MTAITGATIATLAALHLVAPAAVLARASDIPVTPDAPEARNWLVNELAKAPYQAARPTWFDLLSQAVKDWLASLFAPSSGGFAPLLVLLLVVVAAALIVVAFVVFGLPRLRRRSAIAGAVFGDGDVRDADALRRAADAAAASADWNTAIVELFRSVARGLAERTILTVTPGTTAHAFGARAADVFDGEREALTGAAELFDRIRYLGGTASASDYDALAALESRLRSTRPGMLESVGMGASDGGGAGRSRSDGATADGIEPPR